jgi:hypothetical protein
MCSFCVNCLAIRKRICPTLRQAAASAGIRRLTHPQDVLKAYDTLRQPRANMVLERSHRAGVIYEGYGKPGYGLSEMEGHLAGIWEPIWRHDLDADVASAIASLRERGSFPAVTE